MRVGKERCSTLEARAGLSKIVGVQKSSELRAQLRVALKASGVVWMLKVWWFSRSAAERHHRR